MVRDKARTNARKGRARQTIREFQVISLHRKRVHLRTDKNQGKNKPLARRNPDGRAQAARSGAHESSRSPRGPWGASSRFCSSVMFTRRHRAARRPTWMTRPALSRRSYAALMSLCRSGQSTSLGMNSPGERLLVRARCRSCGRFVIRSRGLRPDRSRETSCLDRRSAAGGDRRAREPSDTSSSRCRRCGLGAGGTGRSIRPATFCKPGFSVGVNSSGIRCLCCKPKPAKHLPMSLIDAWISREACDQRATR